MNIDAPASATKRCILFVVDALSKRIVQRWLDDGKLPTIANLISRGGNFNPCTSIFPSITPAATCSIATGVYPHDHGVQGACWYDPIENDTAYFGDDVKLAMQEGLYSYLVDFGDRLNFDRLRSPLIYEHLFEVGVESACINFMWFRGPHVHSRTTPLTLRLAAGKLISDVRGPKYLKLGDFVHSLPDSIKEVEGMSGGLLGRYGFQDKTTAACTLAMAKTNTLPPFTLSYFPVNDDEAHKNGLSEAASVCVEAFDQFLNDFVESVGGWEVVDREYSIVIVGDHSQVEWSDEDPEIVRLDELLSDFKLADTVAGFQDDEELLVCPNMRAAAIYQKMPNDVTRDRLAKTLLEDRGTDQVIYQEDRPDNVCMYTVRTRDRGRLSFSRGRPGSPELKPIGSDRYGNQWCIFGELSAVDLRFDEDAVLTDGDYPNALERIAGAFTAGQSPIWITAKPHAEFAIAESSTHSGGSHGSLHRDDSMAALLTSRDVDLSILPVPTAPRIVDVMDLCLDSLCVNRIVDDKSVSTV